MIRPEDGILSVVRLALSAAACFGLIVTSACATGGTGGPGAGPLHIGVDLPLTGPEGPAARPALNGIRSSSSSIRSSMAST